MDKRKDNVTYTSKHQEHFIPVAYDERFETVSHALVMKVP